MKYNNELKTIDTQEKAYFLGFMYGDGTITTYSESSGRIRYLTKISITKGDKNLIYELKRYFPFFNVGEFNYKKYNKNSGKQKSIAKSSKELYLDLMLNGLYPRKSYENACKLKLPNIDNSLISHFIRGFFDADGSIYISSNRKNLIRIEFASVSKEFLINLNNYLKNIDINCWKLRDKHPSKGRQVCYTLEFIKTSEILKLRDFLYKDANISLKRKADKYLSYVPVNKVLDRNQSCPHCNSLLTTKNGNRGKSTRFKCKSCFQGFSIKNI